MTTAPKQVVIVMVIVTGSTGITRDDGGGDRDGDRDGGGDCLQAVRLPLARQRQAFASASLKGRL
jgi:hypothetical protein